MTPKGVENAARRILEIRREIVKKYAKEIEESCRTHKCSNLELLAWIEFKIDAFIKEAYESLIKEVSIETSDYLESKSRKAQIAELAKTNLMLELCDTVLGNRSVESWYTMPTQPQWFKIVNLAREIQATLKGER
jgi:hypothetical protein